MNWNEQKEEQKPRTPEEVRAAFRVLFGPEIVDGSAPAPEENAPEESLPPLNFPELENPGPTLALQQIKPGENPPKPGFSSVGTGFSEPNTARSPYEPQRGPRGFLNELPEQTQQKILELLETQTRQDVIDVLGRPAPEGIGHHVSEKMLGRFENRHRLIDLRAEIDAMAAAARELTHDPETTDADLTNAALRIIRASVLEYANDIKNFEALERLNNVLYKLRRTDLIQLRLKQSRNQPALSQ
jgi:hypothetical protein